MTIRGSAFALCAAVLGSMLTACATARRPVASAPIRSVALNASIRLGRDIFNDPRKYLAGDVTARLSCSACHIAAGTAAHGGSLVGVYARFPKWSNRAKRVITLQDRIAECFLYSMNGRAPDFSSKEMVALVAYMAWLSRGVRVGSALTPNQSYAVNLPKAAPDRARGAAFYAQKCSICHRASGAGIAGKFPPLWGKTSFNTGAGMAKLHTMTGFVYDNMPKNAPGSLNLIDAYDISAFVLSHARPEFNRRRIVQFGARPAGFF